MSIESELLLAIDFEDIVVEDFANEKAREKPFQNI